MIPSSSGIYKILNLINGKVYVGSAYNLYARWAQHKSRLKMNNHPAKYLQSSWNKYGKQSFRFEVLELVPNRQNLADAEQRWIDQTKCYNREFGYNTRLKAENNFGLIPTNEHRLKISNSLTGIIRSSETKAKMSAWQIGRVMSEASKIKNAKSTRKFDKWPHDDGAFCKCGDCTKQRTDIHREHMKKKKIEKGMAFVSDHIQAMLMGV